MENGSNKKVVVKDEKSNEKKVTKEEKLKGEKKEEKQKVMRCIECKHFLDKYKQPNSDLSLKKQCGHPKNMYENGEGTLFFNKLPHQINGTGIYCGWYKE